MNLKKELFVAKEAAKKAGEAILDIYINSNRNSFNVIYKEDKSPITIADCKSNEIITRTLSESSSNYAFLSEENYDDKKRLENDWCWIIDPLDGTKEFINKNGQFTVNIGLSYRGTPVLGVIYIPVSETLYYSSITMGAYKEVKDRKIR